MKRYKEWSPTRNDSCGLGLEERQEWFVFGCLRTRDSDPLEESNFQVALKTLGGESETVETHRFGHWGPGWFEIILIDPSDAERVKSAEEMIDALSDYPILDEDDHTEREQEAADQTWKNCYSEKERIDYIRRYRSQFEFQCFSDLLGCVRGHYFAGYASELIN